MLTLTHGCRRLARRGVAAARARRSTSCAAARALTTATPEARKYDYVVIGCGSGGVASARRAADHGAKVAVIEKARLGGTCVNVGCVPKKVMYHASELFDAVQHHASGFGISVPDVSFDWQTLQQGRDAYVERLNGIYGRMLEGSGVDIFSGTGSFVNASTVAVSDDLNLVADNILIATGGTPAEANVPGGEHAITSDGFFELTSQPARVAVVGAGYIAVELAGVLASFGVDTSLVIRKDNVLRSFEPFIGQAVLRNLQQAGVSVYPGSSTASIEQTACCRYNLTTEAGATLTSFDKIVWAAGRVPNTDGLGLENAGVTTGSRGYIEVDEYQNTSVPGVHALGDVCGNLELTPVAIAAGRLLSDRLFGGMSTAKMDYTGVPSVVFSHPPVGTVGLTEAQAVAQYGDDNVTCFTSDFVSMYYSLSSHKSRTNMKLVCAGADLKVVGLHIVGQAADEMLQGFAVAMKMGATKADFDATVAIHPTSAEEVVTMKPWQPRPAP